MDILNFLIVTAYFFAGIIRCLIEEIGRFETGENRNGAGNLTAAPEKIRKGIRIKNVLMNQLVAVDETSAVFSHKNKLVHAAFKLHGKGWVWPPAGNDKKNSEFVNLIEYIKKITGHLVLTVQQSAVHVSGNHAHLIK